MTIDHGPALPEGFEELEPFVARWAVPGGDARKRRRIESTEPERLEFYGVMSRHIERALAYLDQYPIEALNEQQRRLMDLALMLTHVALAVESQRDNEAYHAINAAYFTITRTTEGAA